MDKAVKPLGRKAYGSIGHLPGSRLGPGDHRITDGQARICAERTRDHHDFVIVEEKLDGANVCVARVGGELIPLIRAGYPAESARFGHLRMFAAWARENMDRFDAVLREGERLAGEWLVLAHGTRYALPHEPFVAFDLLRGGMERAPREEFWARTRGRFVTPNVLHAAAASCPVTEALRRLADGGGHGAVDPVEGAVWRVERRGKVDFLAKYVRPNKVDGRYLPEISGGEPVWNWLHEREGGLPCSRR